MNSIYVIRRVASRGYLHIMPIISSFNRMGLREPTDGIGRL